MNAASTATPRQVSMEELRRAWHATQRGDFRSPTGISDESETVAESVGFTERAVSPEPVASDASTSGWEAQPGEQLVTVVGCHGSAGATAVAVAIATALSETGLAEPARVVECSSAAASGLAAACSAELGEHPNGWRQGRRDRLLLERVGRVTPRVVDVPLPTPAEHPRLTSVLDVGWDIAHVMGNESWLAATVRAAQHLVVVTTATVPGMRRLEATLDALELAPGAAGARIAVRGPRRKKWSRPVTHAGGHQVARVLAENRCVAIPEDRDLALLGLAPTALPPALVRACQALLPDPAADDL